MTAASRRSRGRGVSAAVTALVAFTVMALASVQAVEVPFSRSGFRGTGSLAGLQYVYYNFVTEPDPATGKIPDVHMLLDTGTTDVTSTADIYCNSEWVTVLGKGSPAQPGDAQFFTENDLGINDIFIPNDDPFVRPPNKRSNTSLEYFTFQPSYNCTIINNDPRMHVFYTLKVAFQYTDVVMAAEEQAAVKAIWNKCCAPVLAVDGKEGGDFRETCVSWTGFNARYSADPITDFCKIPGNVCNTVGHLTTLNLDRWNLECEFPGAEIAVFQDLETLTIATNGELSGKLSDVMATLAVLPAIVNVNLHSNPKLVGSLHANETYRADDPVCALAASGLSMLNLASTGLGGSFFPPCLLGPHSTLTILRIDDNDLGGVIPDNFDKSSPLRIFTALRNNLSGPLPRTLGTLLNLEVLDLTNNQLNGSIPEEVGSSPKLSYLYLGFNNFEGFVPDSLALHPSLKTLDLSYNALTDFPASWFLTNLAAITTTPLVNLDLSYNDLQGVMPAALALLPKLEVLSIASSGLSGTLPSIPGMYQNLRALNVSGNNLQGPISKRWGQSGIFTKEPVTVATVALFTKLTTNMSGTGSTYGQVFDISDNQLSGDLPAFLSANEVSPWVRSGVKIQDNMFNIDCAEAPPPQFAYIAEDSRGLCPQMGVNSPSLSADSTRTPAPVPVSAGQSTTRGGLSRGEIIGVIFGVVAAATIAVLAALLLVRRRNGGHRFLSTQHVKRSHFIGKSVETSGFSKFTDVEMTGGLDHGRQPNSLHFNAHGPAGGHTNGRAV